MKGITGTFIDEISHDIPHQNWGMHEWRQDFKHMKNIGIDTVILIRCGYKKWMCYHSPYLHQREGVYRPYTDLVAMFLDLAQEFGMNFYFGLYDSGVYAWEHDDYDTETDLNQHVIDEVWERYGPHPSFAGWYLSQEVSRKNAGAISYYQKLGNQCKQISGLPVLISPYIDGSKALVSSDEALSKSGISITDHEREWSEILAAIAPSVDIVAFQDGQIQLEELSQYLSLNKSMADACGLESWSNIESFDRDMPIKFLPIKWDKMRMKMEAAQAAGIEKLITFEFSHFMSPQSSYTQAGHLYNRYNEYIRSKA